jgi:hypothetical protein
VLANAILPLTASPAALLDHVRHDRLCDEEGSLEVDVHDEVVRFFLHIQESLTLVHAGAVDQDVDLPEIQRDRLDTCADRRHVCQVHLERLRLATFGGEFRGDLAGALHIHIA